MPTGRANDPAPPRRGAPQVLSRPWPQAGGPRPAASLSGGADLPPPSPPRRPGLGALFLGFLTAGALSFGGGLSAWIRREAVQKRGWIDDRQFLTSYALSQIIPGALNVNLTVFIGSQLRGALGGLAALAGLMLLPLGFFLGLGAAYGALHGTPAGVWVALGLAGAGAAGIGLNLSIGIRLGRRNLRGPAPFAVAGLIALAVGLLGIPLLWTLLVMIPVSLALTPRAEPLAAPPAEGKDGAA